MKLLKNLPFILIITISIVLSLSSCNLLYKYFGIGEHTHQYYWGDEEIIKEPTCLENGEKRLVCTTCGEESIEQITAVGNHIESDWIVDSEESDESDGISHTECVNCGLLINSKTIHRFGEPKVINAPTLTECGVALQQCERCDYSEEISTPSILFFEEVDENTYSVGAATDDLPETLIIPGLFNGKKVTAISNRAFDHTNVVNVVIPEGVTEIGSDAFYACENLTSITIPSTVEEIHLNAFSSSDNIKDVHISDMAAWCSIYFETAFLCYSNPLYYADNLYLNGELVIDAVIPDGVTEIASFAFYSYDKLKSITIPDTVTYYGEAVFKECLGLQSVYIEDIASWCNSTFEYTYESTANFCLSSPMIYANDLYLNGELLTKVVVPEGVTSIPDYAFNSTHITSVTLSSSVSEIKRGAFENCIRLVEVINHSPLDIKVGESSHGAVSYHAIEVHTGESKVFQYGDYVFYQADNKNYLVEYTGNDTVITLPESCNGESYAIYNKFLYRNYNVISVTIPDSVTEIGDECFCESPMLVSVSIGKNVKYIGNFAFSQCDKLIEIINHSSTTVYPNDDCDIHTGESKIIYTDDYIFYNSDHILYLVGYTGNDSDLILPETYNNKNYKIHAYAFSFNDTIKKITIPETITSLPYGAFIYASNLKDVVIPATLTYIDDAAFSYCISLENVYIKDIKAWCDITFAGEHSNPLSYANNLFLNGELITDLVLPDGVVHIPNFAFGSSLTSITIPSSVASIDYYAFSNCTNLESVYVSNINHWLKINYEGYFSNPLVYASKLYFGGELIENVTIPDGITKIPMFAFSCENITSITIPESVSYIEDYAFYECTQLEAVFVSNVDHWLSIEFDYYSSNPLEYADKLYVNGELITELTIPEGIETISAYLFSCDHLESITIPKSVTSIINDAFFGCDSLTSVYIEDLVAWLNIDIYSNPLEYAENLYLNGQLVSEIVVPDEITFIKDNAFFGYVRLERIVIHNNVSSIGNCAFYGCTSLSEVYIDNLEDWVNIYLGNYESNPLYYGADLYVNGELLTELAIPDGITSIPMFNFIGCKSITSVIIPEGIEIIDDSAFLNCKNIVSITIPRSLILISLDVFNGCDNLSDIYYSGTEEDWSNILIDPSNSVLNSATIHYQ